MVMGPSCDGDAKYISVKFARNKSATSVKSTSLALLNGWRIGDQVFYSGDSTILESGEKLTGGALVEVMGPSCSGTDLLNVHFTGSRCNVDVKLSSLLRRTEARGCFSWCCGVLL